MGTPTNATENFFNTATRQIEAKMERIYRLLQQYKALAIKEGADWADIGTAANVNEQLSLILEHLESIKKIKK